MNKTERKFNFKTLFMFLTVLVLSLSMVFATACTNGDSSSESTSASDSSSESTSEAVAVDKQLIANGDFEHLSTKTAPIALSSSSSTYKWAASLDGDSGFQLSSSTVTRAIIDTTEKQTDSKYQEKEGDEVINPGTPATEDVAGTEANEAGKNVLMLRNKERSAQYVTSSSSLAVPAGEYGKITVWVRTSQIESFNKAGAYIKVKNNVTNPTVEGTSYDPLVIEGINTEKAWKEYTIYLAPNQNKATTYTVVLGLGEGNKKNVEKHVKGYAYFDNVAFELIDKATYDAATADATVSVESTVEEGEEVYALTNEGRVEDKAIVKFDLAENPSYDYEIGGTVAPEFASHVTLVDNELKFDFSSCPMGNAYTHVSETLEIPAKTYARISFWAKIEAKDYQTKATMSIFDVNKDKDAVAFTNVSTKDYENEHTDDFARYTFYVANNFDVKMPVQLKITFGPTEDALASTDPKAFPTGTAIFKDFEIEDLTLEGETPEANYDLVDITTDTRAQKGSIIGAFDSDVVEEEDEDEKKDTHNVTVTGYGKTLLDDGEIVGIKHLSSSTLTKLGTNDATIGVVNSEHSYGATIDAALASVQSKLDAKAGDHNKFVQALLVNSASDATSATLLSGNIINIPKNSVYVFSVGVYAHAGAEALVQLTEVMPDLAEDKDKLPVYSTVITNAVSDKFESGFATVTFIIATGYESYDVRLEFGVKGADQVALFQAIVTGVVNASYTSAEAVKANFDSIDYKFAGDVLDHTKTYHYTSADHAGNLDLAVTDDNGDYVVDVSTTKEIASTYATVNSEDENANSVTLVIYNRLDLNDRYTIDIVEGEEESSSEAESESATDSTDSGENYGWLQVTSIIIALALVAALVAVVVRKSMEGKNKKRKQTEKYYQGYDKSKRYSKDNSVAVPDEDEKAKDYDYDNPENN